MVPWWDQDEIAKYGYLSKLISNDWTFENLFKYTGDGDVKFAESMYSHTFSVLQNNLFSRVIKLITLISNSFLIYSFLRIFKIKRVYSLLSVALSLGIPELGYLATSLKTDSTLMSFEIAEQVYLLTALFFVYGKTKLSTNFILKILFIASIFGLLATATRMTGMYLAFFSISTFIFFLLKSEIKSKQKLLIGFFLFGLGIVILHPYIHHFLVFKNPFYPLGSIWPFKNGQYLYDINHFRQIYNLNLKAPPILYELYLLVHMGFGLETGFYNSLTILPHAIAKGNSFGWQSPTLLIVFLIPFLFKKNFKYVITIGLFFVLFIIWSKGIQYSRVFFATSILTNYILIFILSENWQSTFQKKLQQIVIVGTVLIIVFEIIYQSAFSIKKYVHSPLTILSKELLYKANNDYLIHSDWLRQDPNKPFHFLNSSETAALNDILKTKKMPVVLVSNLSPDMKFFPLHIFFSHGIFIQDDIENYLEKSLNVRHLTLSDFDCVLIKEGSNLNKEIQKSINNKFSKKYVLSKNDSIILECLDQFSTINH